jgi:hypothetical protein
MVKVYQARVWDQLNGKNVITPHKWTEEAIHRMGTKQSVPEILLETEEEVLESLLDGDGRYNPDLPRL